ncbi:MAG TPA: S8 family serine peptidase [Mycobacterium sp.]|nr:S8 family serine peptidase [Mycobacterium sp.]
MRLGLTAFAVLAAAVLCGGAIGSGPLPRAEAQAQQPEAEYTGDIVVKFKPAATLAEVGEAIEDAETAPVASTAGSGLVLLEPGAGQSVDGAVADLEANPDVLFAEPDVVMRTAVTPTDPYYGSYQWHLPQIGLPAAWDTTTGSASVIIAVLDTGVQSTHPDLSGKITTGANAGYNFVGNNTNTTDDNSHGTFVAGIIAANTNNGVGGAGVCWSCKIMPVKVLDNTGSGSSFNVAQGIDWSVSHGADVINLSLGGGAASSLSTAVNNAWNANVVVVAATGNDNGPVLYPAAYANAIAVGSNEQNGTRSSFSNYGPEIDIMAPGGSVLGTLCTCNGNPGGYGIGSGTSFATPHVAGVAGLLIASGVTDNDEIRTRLLSTATNMEAAGFDNNTGWGRVNAAAAIAGDAVDPVVTITSPADSATVGGNVTISATATDNDAIERVWFYVDDVYLRSDAQAPYGAVWNTSGVSGSHEIRVRAYDPAGNYADDIINVTVSSDTVDPTVAITTPADGATVAGNVNINVTATDNVGVERVWFYIDGAYLRSDAQAPYNAIWNATGLSGTHEIRVRAYDAAGNFTDVIHDVTVSSDATPPVVNITAPTDGAVVSGVVTISATASDASGIQRVWFYIDGAYLRSDAMAPYSATWNTAGDPGSHQIRVRAYDNFGNFTDVTISVTVP